VVVASVGLAMVQASIALGWPRRPGRMLLASLGAYAALLLGLGLYDAAFHAGLEDGRGG